MVQGGQEDLVYQCLEVQVRPDTQEVLDDRHLILPLDPETCQGDVFQSRLLFMSVLYLWNWDSPSVLVFQEFQVILENQSHPFLLSVL